MSGKTISRLPVSVLSIDPENARKHDEQSIDAIAASLSKFGQVTPIVVDADGIILKGNGTFLAACRLGLTELDAIQTTLTGDEARAYAIADNRTSDLSTWDTERLVEQLQAMEQEYAGATGFSQADIDSLVAELRASMSPEEPPVDADNLPEDDAPPVPEQATAKVGEVWALGDHRLMVGDSTVEANVIKLLGGNLAQMCFTDPPYNVDYQGGTKKKLKIQNDAMSGENFYKFLLAAHQMISAAIAPGSAVYVCHADSEGERFRKAFVESGLLLKQCLIWEKDRLVLGRQDYHWRHEPILYGWKPGAAHRFYGDRKQTTIASLGDAFTVAMDGNGYVLQIRQGIRTVALRVPAYEVIHDGDDSRETVWKIERPLRNAEHPTMKPIRLCGRAVEHGSKPGDIVFDPFLGSGSTLVACQHMKRRCYGFELDPRYADVIIKRWEDLTAKKAVRVEG